MASRDADSEAEGPLDRIRGIVDSVFGRLPGAGLVRGAIAVVEREVLRDLKHRLDRIDAPPSASAADLWTAPAATCGETAPTAVSPGALLSSLLARSLDQDEGQAESDAYLAVLRQLVPDEARIFSALSDGSVYPVVHVTAGSWMVGAPATRVLSHVSSVGQAAGVQCRDMTPQYVSHLRELGLAELGAAEPGLTVQYEILEADRRVREAVRRVESGERRRSARLVRQSLYLTPFGRKLWEACQQGGERRSSPTRD